MTLNNTAQRKTADNPLEAKDEPTRNEATKNHILRNR